MNDKSYTDWKEMSDKALLETIGNFIQKHRLNRNRTQEQVAVAAGISRSTLSLLEKGEKVRMDTFIQVLRVLDLLYIMDIFRIQEQISPVEYARLKKKQRKQASPSRNKNTEKGGPGW